MKLTERRAKDRAIMAERVLQTAATFGFTATLEPIGAREIWIKITTRNGLSLTVDFDGGSVQPDTHVLSWHGVISPYKISPSFAPSVNTCHWHKATDICEGFDTLLSTLNKRFAAIVSGAAFQEG